MHDGKKRATKGRPGGAAFQGLVILDSAEIIGALFVF